MNINKLNKLLLLFLSVAVLGIIAGSVYSRLTGNTQANDIFCVGPAGKEVCLDGSGNLVPTTTNASDLGSSSLYWKDLYLNGVAKIGTAQFTSRVAIPTAAAIRGTIVPTYVGQMVLNTTTPQICVSTGNANAYQWIIADGSGACSN